MSVKCCAVAVVLVAVCWVLLPPLLAPSPSLPPVWGGNTHKHFKHVQQLFRAAVEDGRIKGGSVAAYYRGELVVNLWGGYADQEAQRPWNKETVTVFYSTTKLVAAIVIARMVDRGLLEYGQPVSTYWPEFAQHGKDNITVEMLLSHQGGLAVTERRVSLLEVRDGEGLERLLARQVPQYPPGSQFGYHPVSIGLYVDTLARKVDPKHRSIAQIFKQDIATPFGIDFHLSLPLSLRHRAARIYPLHPTQALWRALLSGDSNALNLLYLSLPWTNSTWYHAIRVVQELDNMNLSNDPDMASITLTSFTGQGTAAGLAKLFSILASGGRYQGKQLLSPSAIKRLGTPLVQGEDQTLFQQAVMGPGPFLRKTKTGGTQIGHPGFGGQVAFADPSTGISFAFCMNQHDIYHFWDNPTMLQLQDAVYQAVESLQHRSN